MITQNAAKTREILPKNSNAKIEKRLLGALIKYSETYDELKEKLDGLPDEIFSEPTYQKIFQAVRALRNEGVVPETLMISAWLEERGFHYDPILIEIISETVSNAAAGQHLEKLVSLYQKRKKTTELGRLISQSESLDDKEFTKVAGKIIEESSEPSEPTKSTAQWPEPIDPAAYYGLAGEIVRAIGPHSEADPVALLIQFLIFFGNVIGRTAYWIVEATRHYLNLFAVLVGETSRGRKGTALDHEQRIYKSIDEEWARERIKSGLSSGEGLKWAVRDPIEKQEPVRDKKTKSIIDYQTNVVDPGVDDKRLLAVEPEFANVLRVIERDGNTLSTCLRMFWDTGNVNTLTKNDPVKVTNGHCSLVGHITKDELQKYLSTTEAANGFANRFLWLCVKRSKLLSRGGKIQTVNFTSILNRLRSAVDFVKNLPDEPIDFDEEAGRQWDNIYPFLTREISGLLGAVTSRSEAQVRRIACLYALLNESPVVRIEHLKAALALWEYCENSCRYIFGDSLGDRTADEILSVLKGRPEGMSRNEIREHFQRNKSSKEIEMALNLLEKNNLAFSRKENPLEKGRPTERWFCKAYKDAVNAVNAING